MQEIEFLKNLLSDAERELEYIENYKADVEAAQKDNAIYAKLWKRRTPSKQRIKEDMRMIRRVSLEVERGL